MNPRDANTPPDVTPPARTRSLETELESLKERVGALELGQDRAFAGLARLEVKMIDLNDNVARGNRINIETQAEVIRLRRDTQDGFHEVSTTLTQIFGSIKDNSPSEGE